MSKEKLHLCTYCQKSFSAKYLLQRHVAVHSGSRNFLCVICGKSFLHSSALSRHASVHEAKFKYQCETCGKQFNRLSTKNVHQLLHQEKAFRCLDCGKAFHQKSNLKSHQLIHTSEKPYNCTECDLTFRQRSNLLVHVRKKHVSQVNNPRSCKNKSSSLKKTETKTKRKKADPRQRRSPGTDKKDLIKRNPDLMKSSSKEECAVGSYTSIRTSPSVVRQNTVPMQPTKCDTSDEEIDSDNLINDENSGHIKDCQMFSTINSKMQHIEQNKTESLEPNKILLSQNVPKRNDNILLTETVLLEQNESISSKETILVRNDNIPAPETVPHLLNGNMPQRMEILLNAAEVSRKALEKTMPFDLDCFKQNKTIVSTCSNSREEKHSHEFVSSDFDSNTRTANDLEKLPSLDITNFVTNIPSVHRERDFCSEDIGVGPELPQCSQNRTRSCFPLSSHQQIFTRPVIKSKYVASTSDHLTATNNDNIDFQPTVNIIANIKRSCRKMNNLLPPCYTTIPSSSPKDILMTKTITAPYCKKQTPRHNAKLRHVKFYTPNEPMKEFLWAIN